MDGSILHLVSPGAYYLLWSKHCRDQLQVPREPRQALVCSVIPLRLPGERSLSDAPLQVGALRSP